MRTRRALSLVVVASMITAAVIPFFTESLSGKTLADHVLFSVALLGYPVVAAVILWRRSHPVGYILLALGSLLAVEDGASMFLEGPTPPTDPSAAGTVLLAVANLAFPLFAMLVPTLGLRFPDGRRLSPRWRWLEIAYAVGVCSVVVGMMLSPVVPGGGPGSDTRWELANPLAAAWTEPVRLGAEYLAPVTLLPAVLGSIVALILRYRRSTGVARQQLRWLTYGLLTVLLTWPVLAGSALLLFGDDAAAFVSAIYSVLIFAVPPIGMGIAISRYRLYDLDRLIRRTVAYTIVTVVLAGLYAGAVVGIGAALRPLLGVDSDLVVALSTLVVAAAFQPVRRRVQRVVDRRFNRARYDAQRTVEAFSATVRNEVELSDVVADLRRAAASTVEPRDVAVWLRPHMVTP